MKAAAARVLLTGASGGIGQAMAAALVGAGAQVMGVGRGALVAPACAAWLQADITHAEAAGEVAAAAAAWQVNVVVHAAGLPGFGALGSVPPDRLAAVLQTNLLAPMLLTQALLPHLLRQPQAQVVFVGSALGRIGVPGFSVYGASKAGLHGFAEALRREMTGTALRVQTLGPRSTRTAFNDAEVQAFNQATATASDSAETVADALVALIESEAAESFIGWPERLAVRLNGALGPALDGSFAKHRRSLPAARRPALTQGALS
jgi:short-subunit dehydrogenase